MSLRDIRQEESPISGAVGNLWALAKHWEYLAVDAANEELREAYLRTAKQLRQRITWLEEKIVEEETKSRHAETVAVLEAFIAAEWITRYTMVDDNVTYWPTEKGRNGARAFLELGKFAPRPKIPVRMERLELVCSWLARNPENQSQ